MLRAASMRRSMWSLGRIPSRYWRALAATSTSPYSNSGDHGCRTPLSIEPGLLQDEVDWLAQRNDTLGGGVVPEVLNLAESGMRLRRELERSYQRLVRDVDLSGLQRLLDGVEGALRSARGKRSLDDVRHRVTDSEEGGSRVLDGLTGLLGHRVERVTGGRRVGVAVRDVLGVVKLLE